MQDFDTLRHRVEETAERLSLAQSERQQEIQSLIGILHDLEEKYGAREKQFAYYRDRIEPLERTNAQLTTLVEKLLELIDRGFGEERLDPLRKASAMATAMLHNDFGARHDDALGSERPQDSDAATDAARETVTETSAEAATETATGFAAEDAGNTGIDLDAETMEIPEPVMATLDDIEADFEDQTEEQDLAEVTAADGQDDSQIIEDLVDLIGEDGDAAPDEAAAQAEQDETTAALEEIDEDEPEDAQFDGVSDLELEEVALTNLKKDIEDALDYVGTDLEAIAAIETPDAVAAGAAEPDMSVRFEDVSDAVLALEKEEDASAGFDDLPKVVRTAAAAFNSADATSEADAINAVARAMEEEVGAEDAAPPAPADIKSLMLRVEALAKKAEAMRLAQTESPATSEDDKPSDTDQKDSGVAA